MRRLVHNLPFEQNRFFTGRKEIIETLHRTLSTESKAVLTQTQVISGLGGIGKTQTALQYAYQFAGEYRYIFWIRADTEVTIQTDFVQIAQHLDLPVKELEQSALIVGSVKRCLAETADPWLLIFDNVEDPELIARYRPGSGRGHILLTSRLSAFDVLGITAPTEMGEMGREDAFQFLLNRTGQKEASLSEEAKTSVRELADELGYLPLALEQAGAYIHKRQTPFPDYLTSYRRRRLTLLEQQSKATTAIGRNRSRQPGRSTLPVFRRNLRQQQTFCA